MQNVSNIGQTAYLSACNSFRMNGEIQILAVHYALPTSKLWKL